MPYGEVLRIRYSDTHSQSGTFIGGKFIPSKSPTTAALVSDQGTRMTCDFVVNGHAMGRCETITIGEGTGAVVSIAAPAPLSPAKRDETG